MRDTASKMPARIWATDAREGLQMWSDEKWPIYSNTEYRRADIVERMAEALADISTNSHHPWSARIASSALTSYREASNVEA